MLKNKLHFIGITILVFTASFLLTNFSQAALIGNTNQATLSLSPATGSFSVGNNFVVSIFLNTTNQNVVATATYLNYNKTNFQVVSVDTTGSVFITEAEKVIDANNGVIKITLGKPTPGVNTSNGLVAKINFKALSVVSPTTDNLTFQFTAGVTNESNVIKDDGLGTDILSGVYNGEYTVSSICTSFTYSVWSDCQPNNTQSRTVIAQTPLGCIGGSSILTQSCNYTSGGGGGGVTPPPKCTIDSDCYPSGFVLGKCGMFYTCSTDGKCYEGSRECPKEQLDIAQIQAEILAVQKSLLELLTLIKTNPSSPDILSQLATLTQEILKISAKIQALKPKFIFTRNLYLGIEGEDVKKLQEFLVKDKTFYPEGLITGYYGILTQKAIQRFQCKYNIVCSGNEVTTGYGRVGPKTRTKLNELYGQ